ncbi:hypothetical protein [Sorangium sp. So ce1097]|uniref:hypothetical protein n=1 Tax=Sorangium sp. So ce1097 TaxID=3133330 RepID=UPI003F5E0BDA
MDESTCNRFITWTDPSQRHINSNRNNLDATRDGAYAVALVCLEKQLNLVAVCRAEERTGADWYVAPPGRGVLDSGIPDLDDPAVVRLEVGGHDDRSSLAYELKEKVRQLEVGDSDKTGVAAVVGFKKARILIQTGVGAGQR